MVLLSGNNSVKNSPNIPSLNTIANLHKSPNVSQNFRLVGLARGITP
jgi:hypothetical protein